MYEMKIKNPNYIEANYIHVFRFALKYMVVF